MLNITRGSKDRLPFRRYHDLRVGFAGSLQPGCQGLFRYTGTIHFGSVKPIDASVKGSFDNSVLFFQRNYREHATDKSASASQLHNAQADRRDQNVRPSKAPHLNILIRFHC